MTMPLTLHTPAHIDPLRHTVADLRKLGGVLTKSIDVHGGSYRGRLTLEGELGRMETLFGYLGYEVREDGGRSFIGIIREMTLAHQGVSETVTLDDVANRVTAVYQDGAGGELETEAENSRSIDRYGLYEVRLRLDTEVLTAAETHRDAYLAGHAWPVPQVTSLRVGEVGGMAQLDIDIVGSSYELRGVYPDFAGEITAGRNTLSELVRFIATEGGFTAGDIRTNTIEWNQAIGDDDALRVLTRICELGGSDARPWLWWIDRHRNLNYAPYPTEPRYFLYGGQLRDRANNPVRGKERHVTTGVIRRMGAHRPARPGHWLTDGRDFYASRVEVDANDQLTFTVQGYDEFELLNAQADAQRIEEGTAPTPQATGGGGLG